MATRYYLGVDGNWENTANWSASTVPVDDDDVIIANSDTDLTTNLDQLPGGTEVDLASLKVAESYTGNLGSSGNPLKIASAETWIAGAGDVYLEGATSHDLPLIHVDKPGSFSKVANLAGYIGEVNVKRGRCEIAANFNGDVTLTFRCLFRNQQGQDAELIIGAGGTVAELVVTGGRVVNDSAITTIRLSGGSFKTTTGAITTGYQYGGTFYWENDETITTLYGYGGKFDATGNTQVQTTPTVTNVYGFSGWTADLRNGIGTISWGASVLKDADATVMVDP